MAALRIRDIAQLYRSRYRGELPHDPVGLDAARIAVHHLACLSGDPRKRIGGWLRLWAPWLSLLEAEQLLVEAITKPLRWRADKLGWRLRVTEQERRALGITTIGAIDLPKAERIARRKASAKHRKLQLRRAQGAKPRAEYEAASTNRAKPWIAAGLSRASWYRKRRETSAATA